MPRGRPTGAGWRSRAPGPQRGDLRLRRGQRRPDPDHVRSRADRDPAWSPDGTRLVFESLCDGNRSSMSCRPPAARRCTSRRIRGTPPAAWSSTGKIAFASNRRAIRRLLDGRGRSGVRRLTQVPESDAESTWAPSAIASRTFTADMVVLDVRVVDATGPMAGRCSTAAMETIRVGRPTAPASPIPSKGFAGSDVCGWINGGLPAPGHAPASGPELGSVAGSGRPAQTPARTSPCRRWRGRC